MGTTQEFAPQNWREYRRLRSWEILVGETPLVRCKVTRDRYSVIAFGALKAISASTPTGEPYLAMQAEAYDSAGVIAFLEQLLCAIAGKLLIIWDGAPIHRSRAINTFLAAGAAERICWSASQLRTGLEPG